MTSQKKNYLMKKNSFLKIKKKKLLRILLYLVWPFYKKFLAPPLLYRKTLWGLGLTENSV